MFSDSQQKRSLTVENLESTEACRLEHNITHSLPERSAGNSGASSPHPRPPPAPSRVCIYAANIYGAPATSQAPRSRICWADRRPRGGMVGKGRGGGSVLVGSTAGGPTAGGRGRAAPEGRGLSRGCPSRGLRSQCAWELGGSKRPL